MSRPDSGTQALSTPTPDTPSHFKSVRQQLLSDHYDQLSQRREALTVACDNWLAQLYHTGVDTPLQGNSALIAVGGYGRRELSPGSDLDVVLLHQPGLSVAASADSIWYPIWDAGVRLDHSVRTPAATRRLANSDIKVLLGLLDARTIAGNDELLASLRSSVLADWRAKAHRHMDELREVIETRAELFGQLAYLQEPDLKESLGGLRDVTILRAVAASWLTEVPRARLAQPYRTLLDTRDALHSVSGRSSDKLVREYQADVALSLGVVTDHAGEGAADAALRQVASAARTIDWASDLVWHRVTRLGRPGRVAGLRKLGNKGASPRVPLTTGAVIDKGEVILARDAKPTRDPELMLRAAAAAAGAGLRLAPGTLRVLSESAPLPLTPWSDATRQNFLALLGAGRHTIAAWESLDQEGYISALIPEWEATRSAPQNNPIHRYTVDRHSLETVVQANQFVRDISRPDLLLTAALLHDIGKPVDGPRHAEVGAVLARTIASRMGFNDIDTAAIELLVRNHLLLADLATRHDVADPAVIETVTAAIGSLEALEMLWLLTQADARATGPAACSAWRMTLIQQLYSNARAKLSGRTAPAPSTPTEAELAAATASGVVVMSRQTSGLTELVVSADGQHLAPIAGVLALHRQQVVSATVRAIGEKLVSTWRVVPLYADAPETNRISIDLRRAKQGSLPLPTLLAGVTSAPTAEHPEVLPAHIEATATAQLTRLEVRAPDSRALLYRLLAAIESSGALVHAARVSTLGADVVDVFEVTNGQGRALSSSHLLALQAELQRVALPPQ